MLLTLLPDLNIAPLKYRHVHRDHGGPLTALSAVEVSPGIFSATAQLASGAHGEALAPTQPEAAHKAISRAMAHWAWLLAEKDPALAASLRFDLDATPTGFAAFPGLGVQGAKKRAYFAAAEQWALRAWWNGALAAAPAENGFVLNPPIPGVTVALINGEKGFASAASYNAASALAKAKLRPLRPLPPGFRERAGQKITAKPAAPALALDLPVLGPWQPYAHVWRCLFDCSAFREKIFP